MAFSHLVASIVLVLIIAPAWGATPEEEAWFADDAELRAAAVNEGTLAFLPQPPQTAVHHHHNELRVRASSLQDGWVGMRQCHEQIDPVPRAQIVYNPERIRGLTLLSQTGVGRAWVDGASVQLEDIVRGATLCVEAETRALVANGDGSFSLRNGPFMRRFLDGYYPMRVSVDIEIPREVLRFAEIQPAQQPGFRVWESAGGIHFDAWFEGELRTEIRFSREFCDNPEAGPC